MFVYNTCELCTTFVHNLTSMWYWFNWSILYFKMSMHMIVPLNGKIIKIDHNPFILETNLNVWLTDENKLYACK